jgi:hypothetical protein
MGPAGPTGLDYNVLNFDLSRLGVDAARFDELRAEIKVIEIAALGEINRKTD